MNPTEVRIRTEGLRPGMWVVKLDRPWLETPHLMQAFLVESKADVDRVTSYSKYVYIDTTRGARPEPRYVLGDDKLGGVLPLEESLPGFGKAEYEKQVSLQEELSEAREIRLKIDHVLTDAITSLREDKKLDIDSMRSGVKAMIGSILRNPEALAWLGQLKQLDSYTYHHSIGTSVWAATLARHLGLPRESIELLALGGLLLDVGKTNLPEDLVVSDKRLTPDELREMRRHVEYSVALLKETPGLEKRVLNMVATHHERFDGSGYPQGLRGDEIPIFGRIAAIVDTYDAITSRRPYAKAMSPHGAVSVLYEWRGMDFQPELVERFIQAIGIYPSGTLVELTTGEVGVIISINDSRRLRPRIMLLLDAHKQSYKQFREIDMMQDPTDEFGKKFDIKRGLPPGSYGIDTHELFL